MISLFTLNFWRYYDFDKRLPNVIAKIKQKSPDIVFLQETQIDESFSSFAQVEIIKKNLSEYKYSIHSTIYLKESQRGKKLDKSVQHGMSVLSKHPILNSFEYYVPRNDGEDEQRSILCFDVEIGSRIYKFANIHFANKEDWAKNQLIDFLKFINQRNEKRIMAGDFNLYDLPKYLNSPSIAEGYELSFNFKNYISYPEKNWCLDYILIPNNFKFKSVETTETYVSDHKGVFAEISKNTSATTGL